MKRILILAGVSLFLCSTASAFQGGGGESTKKSTNKSARKGSNKKKESAKAPLSRSNSSTTFLVEGLLDPAAGKEFEGLYRVCTPGYFQTIGIRLIQGRLFSDSDKAETPLVVIVNEALAKPIGRTRTRSEDAFGFQAKSIGIPGGKWSV